MQHAVALTQHPIKRQRTKANSSTRCYGTVYPPRFIALERDTFSYMIVSKLRNLIMTTISIDTF